MGSQKIPTETPERRQGRGHRRTQKRKEQLRRKRATKTRAKQQNPDNRTELERYIDWFFATPEEARRGQNATRTAKKHRKRSKIYQEAAIHQPTEDQRDQEPRKDKEGSTAQKQSTESIRTEENSRPPKKPADAGATQTKSKTSGPHYKKAKNKPHR